MMFRFEKEMRKPVKQWLLGRGYYSAVEFWTNQGIVDIVAGSYGNRPAKNRKPLLVDIWSVELKLTDVAGVLYQANCNKDYFEQSWVAMPLCRINKMTPRTKKKFTDSGIGLLSVTNKEVLIVARPLSEYKIILDRQRIEKQLWRRVRKQYKEYGE